MDHSKLIILAIDDIEDNLISLKAVIKEAIPNAIVFTATNGKAGIDLARKTDPDMIFLDIIMPDLDGYETCSVLKNDPEMQDIPVVFLTALKTERKNRIRALEVGADGFLNKPIDEELLIAMIHAMKKLKMAEVMKRHQTEELEEQVAKRTQELENAYNELQMHQAQRESLLDSLYSEIESRKQTEAEKIKSENLLKKVFELLPIGVWIADSKGKLVISNEAGRKIWGMEPLVGQEDYGIFKAKRLPSREDVAPDDWALNHTVNSKQTIKDEMLEISAFDDVKRIILNFTAPVLDEDNQVEAAIVVNQDISEQVRQEMMLKLQSKIAKAAVSIKNLRELCRLIRDELAVLFDTTNFVYASYNPVTDMLHADLELDEGGDGISEWKAQQSLTGYMLYSRAPLLITRDEIQELHNEGVLIQRGDLASCWMGVPLFQGDSVVGAMFVQSYTNTKAYDQKSLELFEMVAHELSLYIERKDSEEELIKAKNKAEEGDKLKTAFLQNMSHEIRTPMNGILGFTGILEKGNLSPEEVKEYAGYIKSSGKRMMDLIRNILDVSKIESGENEVVYSTFLLDKLLMESQVSYEESAKAKNLILNYHLPEEHKDLKVISDEQKLSQILSNLLNNAIKFTTKGRVDFGVRLDANKLIFEVSDTGIGIPPEFHQRIFERFFQVDMSMTRGIEGAGLGLSICLGLIKCLNGSIEVQSELDKGSRFTVSIPVEIENFYPERNIEPETDNAKPECSLILIAEDDDLNYMFLNRVLALNQLKSIRAKNGQEAVDIAIQRDDISLILMDIKMPIMNGITATKMIKSAKSMLPIVAQSAYAFETEVANALEAGCDAYLTKPINTEEMLCTIKRLCSEN